MIFPGKSSTDQQSLYCTQRDKSERSQKYVSSVTGSEKLYHRATYTAVCKNGTDLAIGFVDTCYHYQQCNGNCNHLFTMQQRDFRRNWYGTCYEKKLWSYKFNWLNYPQKVPTECLELILVVSVVIKQTKMLSRVALWSLVLAALMEPGVQGFECQEQAQSQEGSCHCELSGQPSYQYDIFCPYVTDSKVHFKFEEDKFIVMTCR